MQACSQLSTRRLATHPTSRAIYKQSVKPCKALRQSAHRRLGLKVCASAANPEDDGGSDPTPAPVAKEVSLVRPFITAGNAFVLAGFLKLLTIGWVVTTAPNDCVRTSAGEFSRYLLVPIALLLCFLAKKIVDARLNENNKFMGYLLAFLAFCYFGLYSVLYRYDGGSLPNRAPPPAPVGTHSPYRAGNPMNRRTYAEKQQSGYFDGPSTYYTGRTPEMAGRDAELERQIPEGVLGPESTATAQPQRRSRMAARRAAKPQQQMASDDWM